jgi:hypothetical protein
MFDHSFSEIGPHPLSGAREHFFESEVLHKCSLSLADEVWRHEFQQSTYNPTNLARLSVAGKFSEDEEAAYIIDALLLTQPVDAKLQTLAT